MRLSRWFALATAICTGCSMPIQSDRDTPVLIVVPITLRNNLPTARVVAGGAPLDLFLDLGGHNSISLTAEELATANVRNLEPPDQYQNVDGTVYTARRFEVSNVMINGHAFGSVIGGEYVHPSSGGPPDRNGYIGKAFLTKYMLVLDYPHNRVMLYPRDDRAAFRKECGAPQYSIEDADGGIMSYADTSYGRMRFNWDTGATHNFVRRVSVGPTGIRAARTIDDGSPVLAISSIQLGTVRLGEMEFRLSNATLPPVDGVFGTGLFKDHKVCFDFVNGVGAIVSGHG